MQVAGPTARQQAVEVVVARQQEEQVGGNRQGVEPRKETLHKDEVQRVERGEEEAYVAFPTAAAAKEEEGQEERHTASHADQSRVVQEGKHGFLQWRSAGGE